MGDIKSIYKVQNDFIHSVYDNKHRAKRLSELSQLILDVDNRYASSLTPELNKERLSNSDCYTNLSTKQMEQLLFKSRQK
jgi:hypothetical protein